MRKVIGNLLHTILDQLFDGNGVVLRLRNCTIWYSAATGASEHRHCYFLGIPGDDRPEHFPFNNFDMYWFVYVMVFEICVKYPICYLLSVQDAKMPNEQLVAEAQSRSVPESLTRLSARKDPPRPPLCRVTALVICRSIDSFCVNLTNAEKVLQELLQLLR
jgi:hypothetical protein